jgi:hypothetical protein
MDIKIEHGYVIRGVAGGYFEVNGLGDWTLAGDMQNASIYIDRNEAQNTMNENVLNTDAEIVEVNRLTAFKLGPLTEAELVKFRNFLE